MRQELLTSEVTGLPNRRAFEEAGPALAIAMSDMDALKAVNKYGYMTGNAVLRAKADVLREAGLEAYHDKGDEFLCRGDVADDLVARLECCRTMLRSRTIIVARNGGTTLRIRGADFSYGVGHDIEEAETRLREHKAEREARGEVSRGQLCGVSIRIEEPHQSHAVMLANPPAVTSVPSLLRKF